MVLGYGSPTELYRVTVIIIWSKSHRQLKAAAGWGPSLNALSTRSTGFPQIPTVVSYTKTISSLSGKKRLIYYLRKYEKSKKHENVRENQVSLSQKEMLVLKSIPSLPRYIHLLTSDRSKVAALRKPGAEALGCAVRSQATSNAQVASAHQSRGIPRSPAGARFIARLQLTSVAATVVLPFCPTGNTIQVRRLPMQTGPFDSTSSSASFIKWMESIIKFPILWLEKWDVKLIKIPLEINKWC